MKFDRANATTLEAVFFLYLRIFGPGNGSRVAINVDLVLVLVVVVVGGGGAVVIRFSMY